MTDNQTPGAGATGSTRDAQPVQASESSLPGIPAAPPVATAPEKSARRSILTDPAPWLTLAAVFAADQLTKTAVVRSLVRGESWPPDGFFRISHAWNTGTAFGLFQDYGGVLTVVSLLAVVVLFYFYRSASSPSLLVRTAFGLQLGGAFGNLFDRVRLGHVTDFIDVGPWPVFNLADSSIVVGIALMAWHMWNASAEKKPPPGVPGQG
jgi:signal peptidase II